VKKKKKTDDAADPSHGAHCMLNAREFLFLLDTRLHYLQIVTFGISSPAVRFVDFHMEIWVNRYEPLLWVLESISDESWQQ